MPKYYYVAVYIGLDGNKYAEMFSCVEYADILDTIEIYRARTHKDIISLYPMRTKKSAIEQTARMNKRLEIARRIVENDNLPF